MERGRMVEKYVHSWSCEASRYEASGNAEERKWNSSGKMEEINLWEDDLAEQISGVQLGRFRGTSRYRGLHERYVTITEGTLQQITRVSCLQGNVMLLCLDIKPDTASPSRDVAPCVCPSSPSTKGQETKEQTPLFLFDIFLFLRGRIGLFCRGTSIDWQSDSFY